MSRPMIADVFADRPNEPNDPYGTFEGTALGSRCQYVIAPLADRDPRARDALGTPLHRGGSAIHVSGRDPFGHQTGPGLVREIGLYECRFYDPLNAPSGFGCHGAEGAVLVTWDDCHHGQPEVWRHHAFWSSADLYVSIQGIYETWAARGRHDLVTARTVCQWMDWRREGRSAIRFAGDRMHEAAVRRLLEAEVGAQNVIPDWSRPLMRAWLVRRGRWSYGFDGGPPDDPPVVIGDGRQV